MYIILGGYRPFRGEGDECLEKIRYGEYTFLRKYWSEVSDDAKRLISGMLTVDVQRRVTAEEALESDWIVSYEEQRRARKVAAKRKKAKAAKQRNSEIDPAHNKSRFES